MRTSRTNLVLLVCFICLTIHVQQCNPLALFTLLSGANAMASSAMTASAALGMNMLGSTLQALGSTIRLGFVTMQTMTLSLISGFIMGVMALSGFIFFLLTIVPAEEYRGIGVASAAKLSLQSRFPLLTHNSNFILNATSSEPSFLRNLNFKNTNFTSYSNVSSERRRSKRSTLVRNVTVITNGPVPQSSSSYSLESIAKIVNASDERIPRFLTRFVQRDPFNCLPLIMCGLSAASRPNERTETLNDLAYLTKELLEDVADQDDKSEVEDDSSQEDDLFVSGKMTSMKNKESKLRSPLDFLLGRHKKKDEVDEMIDQMHREEDDKIEDIVLTEMADDPHDLKFALEEMKVRGLKKTMSKMSNAEKIKYIQKLMMRERSEEEEGEDMEEYEGRHVPMEYRGRHEYSDPSYEEYGSYYKPPRRLLRGGYPPPPPEPPVPEYGSRDSNSDGFFKRNLNVKSSKTSKKGPTRPTVRSRNKVLIATPIPPRRGGGKKRNKRETIWSNRQSRAYIQKKRGEFMETNNLYDRARIGAEVGSVARNNRQCRAFFQGCPTTGRNRRRPSASSSSSTKKSRPSYSSNKNVEDDNEGDSTPFLNRAVNNIRRVLLGPDPVSSKVKRVNEIREVIQQIHPQANHGGSEVKVVLNIGPSAGPSQVISAGGVPDMNRVISPVVQYMPPSPTPQELGLPPPFSTQLVPKKPTDRYVVSKKPIMTTSRPRTTPRPPAPQTTKKVLNYKNPASTSASKKPLPPLFSVPPTNLDKLANFLKSTGSTTNSEEGTTMQDFEETTIYPVVFSDGASGSEEDRVPSVEEELVTPTKYPLSKEEYADNLRETFNIFNRFKEAHRNPPAPPTTAEAAAQSTSLGSAKTTKKTPLQKKPSSTSVSPTGAVGETAQGDEEGQEGQDVGAIWENFKESIKDTLDKIRDRKKKKKKRKRKKKRKKKPGYESSEESSEEEHIHHHAPPKPPPLVAVPHPHDRSKIHWRSGTQLLTDKFYHLFFGKRVAKPLPDSSAKSDYKSSDEANFKDDKDRDEDETQYSDQDTSERKVGRWRTESITDSKEKAGTKKQIPVTTPPSKKDVSKGGVKKAGPILLVATPEPTHSSTSKSVQGKAKKKSKYKVKKVKPSPTPESMEDDEDEVIENDAEDQKPSMHSRKNVSPPKDNPEDSTEDEDEPDEDEAQDFPQESEESKEYSEYQTPPQPRPNHRTSHASGSYEDDAEEEEDADGDGENYEVGEVETKPKLLFNPFSVEVFGSGSSGSNSRGRIGLESRESTSSGKSKRRKKDKKKSKQKSPPTPPPAKIKFSDLYGPKNLTENKNLFQNRRSSIIKVSRSTVVATVKPKRKVLRYKNG